MSHAVLTELVVPESSPPGQKQLAAGPYQTDWHLVYLLGGIAALTVTALIPLQGLVYLLWPPPTTVLDYFRVFQSNPVLGFV